uniref:Interleukin-6 receptor subunit alpha n=1 Tax=Geotrypetes seraphini TaxID=260995 RepID=A0A6P8Q2Y5_GEOSA|nr:interleukin-6 receptor subunit alpha [Geotrypetes seraphini]
MWPLACTMAISLLLASKSFQMRQCPKPVLPAEAWLRPAGVDVNLTCLNEKPNNSSISWKLQNRTLPLKALNRVMMKEQLLLKSVRSTDSGNYSCYRDGQRVCNIQLLVGEILEKPKLTCYRKFPVSNIRCEWKPLKRISTVTKAVLQVQKGFNDDDFFTEKCTYYQSTQTFSCRLKNREEDDSTYVVSICVMNNVDSQSSNKEMFTGNNILQPDPPTNVTVKAVERSPQKLIVTWSYPLTWRNNYYRLKFKIRYRAEYSVVFTVVYSQKTSILITDAWMDKNNIIQVQAREEFDHGSWSTWSHEVTGIPWTGYQDQGDPVMEPSPSRFYDYTEDVTYTYSEEYSNLELDPNENTLSMKESMVPWHIFFLAGASLVPGIILFMGIIIRYKKKWKQTLKEEKLSIFLQYSPIQLVLERWKPNSNATTIFPPSESAPSDTS